MALIREDRIVETSTSTGTGDFTLAGAVTGFRAFSSVCAVADTFYYVIEGVTAGGILTGEWESGYGTYSATNTLTRTTVTRSSNGNAAVSFSAGTKRVMSAATSTALGNVQSGQPPVIRGTSKATASAASCVITLPTGSAAGDDAYIFYAAGNVFTTATGWSQLDDSYFAGTWLGAILHKRLTAADITAASVTVNAAASFRIELQMVTFVGAVTGVIWHRIRNATSGQAPSVFQNKNWSSPPLTTNDMLIVVPTVRASSASTVSIGTQQQNDQQTDGSMALYTYPVTAQGHVDFTVNIPSAGSLDNLLIMCAVRG